MKNIPSIKERIRKWRPEWMREPVRSLNNRVSIILIGFLLVITLIQLLFREQFIYRGDTLLLRLVQIILLSALVIYQAYHTLPKRKLVVISMVNALYTLILGVFLMLIYMGDPAFYNQYDREIYYIIKGIDSYLSLFYFLYFFVISVLLLIYILFRKTQIRLLFGFIVLAVLHSSSLLFRISALFWTDKSIETNLFFTGPLVIPIILDFVTFRLMDTQYGEQLPSTSLSTPPASPL